MESGSNQPGLHVDVARWAQSAFNELGDLQGVSRVGLALVEGGGRRLLFAASDRNRADLDWCHIDAFDEVPLNDAIGSGTKVVGLVNDLDPRYGAFIAGQRDAGFAAIAAVPIKASGRVLGGFVLYYAKSQPFEHRQCAELDDLADNLAIRLHAALHRPGPTIPNYLPPKDSLVAAQEFPPDPASVAQARLFLDKTLADWGVGDETRLDATLCLSELVTNALVHAHSGCCVQIELHEQVLRIEVHDNGPGIELLAAEASDDVHPHGRGLQLVDVLASRWGQVDGPDRAVVWFALDI